MRVVVLLCLSVVLAAGSRPVPFRTRKLSLPAPMVLHPGGCGRVGHRRHFSLCVVGWCHPFTAFVGHRPCQGLGGHRVVGVWHHPTFFVPFSRPVARALFRAPWPVRCSAPTPRAERARVSRAVRPPGGEESRNARVPGALWPARRRPVEKRSGVGVRASARRGRVRRGGGVGRGRRSPAPAPESRRRDVSAASVSVRRLDSPVLTGQRIRERQDLRGQAHRAAVVLLVDERHVR